MTSPETPAFSKELAQRLNTLLDDNPDAARALAREHGIPFTNAQELQAMVATAVRRALQDIPRSREPSVRATTSVKSQDPRLHTPSPPISTGKHTSYFASLPIDAKRQVAHVLSLPVSEASTVGTPASLETSFERTPEAFDGILTTRTFLYGRGNGKGTVYERALLCSAGTHRARPIAVECQIIKRDIASRARDPYFQYRNCRIVLTITDVHTNEDDQFVIGPAYSPVFDPNATRLPLFPDSPARYSFHPDCLAARAFRLSGTGDRPMRANSSAEASPNELDRYSLARLPGGALFAHILAPIDDTSGPIDWEMELRQIADVDLVRLCAGTTSPRPVFGQQDGIGKPHFLSQNLALHSILFRGSGRKGEE